MRRNEYYALIACGALYDVTTKALWEKLKDTNERWSLVDSVWGFESSTLDTRDLMGDAAKVAYATRHDVTLWEAAIKDDPFLPGVNFSIRRFAAIDGEGYWTCRYAQQKDLDNLDCRTGVALPYYGVIERPSVITQAQEYNDRLSQCAARNAGWKLRK